MVSSSVQRGGCGPGCQPDGGPEIDWVTFFVFLLVNNILLVKHFLLNWPWASTSLGTPLMVCLINCKWFRFSLKKTEMRFLNGTSI